MNVHIHRQQSSACHRRVPTRVLRASRNANSGARDTCLSRMVGVAGRREAIFMQEWQKKRAGRAWVFRSSGIANFEALGRTRHEITEGTSARADAARPGDCNATRRRFGSKFERQAYVLITQRDDAGAGPRVQRRHQCAYEQSDKARWLGRRVSACRKRTCESPPRSPWTFPKWRERSQRAGRGSGGGLGSGAGVDPGDNISPRCHLLLRLLLVLTICKRIFSPKSDFSHCLLLLWRHLGLQPRLLHRENARRFSLCDAPTPDGLYTASRAASVGDAPTASTTLLLAN
ncbi:uncharacterized protein SCHCODRAFT_02665707 [Schizophyllum commune H4-8]|uniref:uncharacterized protein n=1 Tax=Schizophyllum commune (strain H4-8 / FGSC 9210) TaxID=578458 RepID=UPI0021610348|nr:uncharacterized protein SCHCODRAFT_02665707 [Schizophyllum commune H4-8]KAI5895348.1 hypothetical protein SCHCODRAFT_02665707 [Schizophyllum commune H4-8]